MNTPFESTSFRWIDFSLHKFASEYDFWKEQVCSEKIKKYKFAGSTTFVWTVQIWDGYDFCLKGKSLQRLRLLFER